jgi:hypothetical protein
LGNLWPLKCYKKERKGRIQREEKKMKEKYRKEKKMKIKILRLLE